MVSSAAPACFVPGVGRNTFHEAAIQTDLSGPSNREMAASTVRLGRRGRNLSELSSKIQRIAAAG